MAAEGGEDAGTCSAGGWEWWIDSEKVVKLELVTKYGPGGRHCCDGNNTNVVWWF